MTTKPQRPLTEQEKDRLRKELRLLIEFTRKTGHLTVIESYAEEYIEEFLKLAKPDECVEIDDIIEKLKTHTFPGHQLGHIYHLLCSGIIAQQLMSKYGLPGTPNDN